MLRHKSFFLFVLLVIFVPHAAHTQQSVDLVTRSDVKFQPLNPLRGDASPKAGVLWGDIKKLVPTGTLIQFRDGFSSPPHIHNITYRAVVISGEVHNDDPEAEVMWMGPGSFWVQPAGEVHITSAKGEMTTAFLEILEGPYLVQPSEEAFDNGERPINIEARNVVWLDPSDVSWIAHSGDTQAPEMAFLWGEMEQGQRNGTFLRLPAETTGQLDATGEWLRAVVIQGDVSHAQPNAATAVELEPGSYFGAPGGVTHTLSCDTSDECLLYITAKGKITFSSD
ncbi:MAG: DUF4437 domain-containing protein [Pseudomonadota bacterium]